MHSDSIYVLNIKNFLGFGKVKEHSSDRNLLPKYLRHNICRN